MLLAAVVETSQRVADTTKRLEKTDLLATLLRRLDPGETEIVVAFLSGGARQGRIGVGHATLRNTTAQPAETPSLEIRDIDRALESLGHLFS
jgi:DNA ligase-1